MSAFCKDCPNVYDCILKCERDAVRNGGGTSWNFRILQDSDGRVEIHEIYYDEDGRPEAWTERTARAEADSIEGLRWKLSAFLRALDEEILEIDDGELHHV